MKGGITGGRIALGNAGIEVASCTPAHVTRCSLPVRHSKHSKLELIVGRGEGRQRKEGRRRKEKDDREKRPEEGRKGVGKG